MKVKKNITIELSEEDVKKIIADYLSKEGYKATPDNVRLDVSSRLEGYGMGEHEVTRFNRAIIKCEA